MLITIVNQFCRQWPLFNVYEIVALPIIYIRIIRSKARQSIIITRFRSLGFYKDNFLFC